MQPHVDRMHAELFELDSRIQKLSDFFKTALFNSLLPHEQDLMHTQYCAMTTYQCVLRIRVKLAGD